MDKEVSTAFSLPDKGLEIMATAIDHTLAMRATLRDQYANLYNRGYSLDRMAITDFDYRFRTCGRIEIIEKVALQVMDEPSSLHMSVEEQHYADWLSKLANTRERNQFLSDFFLYGLSEKASL